MWVNILFRGMYRYICIYVTIYEYIMYVDLHILYLKYTYNICMCIYYFRMYDSIYFWIS